MTRACRHGTVGQRGCERNVGIGYLSIIGRLCLSILGLFATNFYSISRKKTLKIRAL